MPANWFDEDVAETYDDGVQPPPSAAIDLLTRLAAPGGRALEFAIGTGRFALPLAARGVHVEGVELSAAMLARLRAKPGGDEARIPVVVGDMTTASRQGPFDVVFLVFNTIMNLTAQVAQTACFANAARHLRSGGAFLVETGIPALRLLPPGERYVTVEVTEQHVCVDEYDVLTQQLVSHHITTSADGRVTRRSVPFRYVWPAELDLMAEMAGLHLQDRWADWDQNPLSEGSESHISIWTKD